MTRAITEEQLEQVINAIECNNPHIFMSTSNAEEAKRNLMIALTTLRDLPELKFHYIKDHPAGFTSTQQRYIWEKQMEKMKEKKG